MKSILFPARLRFVRRLFLTAGLVGAAFAAVSDASAQQTVWKGGTGNWSDGSRWSNGVPDGVTAQVSIDGGKGVNSLVTMDGTFTVGKLVISPGDALDIGSGQTVFFNDSGGFTGAGTITNDGTLTVGTSSTGNRNLDLHGNITLNGTGTTTLGLGDTIRGNNSTLTIGSGQTVNGGTNSDLGLGQASFVNHGTIDANSSGNSLPFDPGPDGLTNTGTMRASGGGVLALVGNSGAAGPYVNQGTITALAGSEVQLSGSAILSGGTLSSVGTGIIRNIDTATLGDLTNEGTFIVNSSGVLYLSGTITNDGQITIGTSDPGNSNLQLQGDVTLDGTGTLILLHGDTIRGSNSSLTIGSGETIDGATVNTTLGETQTTIINHGTIDANSPGNALNLAPSTGGLTSDGILEASGGGVLQFNSYADTAGPFTSNGTMAAMPGSTVALGDGAVLTNLAGNTLTGGIYKAIADASGAMATLDFGAATFAVNKATIVLSGANSVFAAVEPLSDNQGSFSLLGQRQFTTMGNLSNEGTLAIGPGSTLHAAGTCVASASSRLAITVGGTSSSGPKSPGVLQVSGAATLAGKLKVNFTAGAKLPGYGAELAVFSAASVGGAFANVANGARLMTSDGKGSFIVNYGADSAFAPTQVVLTKFTTETMPMITSADTATGIVGQPFSYTITATQNTTAYGAAGLRDGLTINARTGVISGTPTTAGKFSVTIKATNQYGPVTAPLTITIKVPPPTVTSAGTATAKVTVSFSYQITGTNNPTSFHALGLPESFRVNAQTGVISGTATVADVGTHHITLEAVNGTGTGSKALTLSIVEPAAPTISSAGAANATQGQAFSYKIMATHGPTRFGVLGLTPGLSVDARTGIISGAPTTHGSFELTLKATNDVGTGKKTLTLTIAEAAPVITSGDTAAGTQNQSFGYQIVATNDPTHYSVLGLPTGLHIDAATGLISGTPTGYGKFTPTLRALNDGGMGTLTLTLTVTQAVPSITSAGAASGEVGAAFSYQITATNEPTRFGTVGLPPGLHVDAGTGLISGTPTKAGTFTLTLKAANSGGPGQKTLTLTIAAS